MYFGKDMYNNQVVVIYKLYFVPNLKLNSGFYAIVGRRGVVSSSVE
jgi:hypothetical protein